MIDVLFIQGASKGAHVADAKLAASLAEHLGADYKVRYPRMPREDEPRYGAWASTFSNELAEANSPLVFVGHSLGASFLLRYLALNDIEPRPLGVFLAAAPYVGGLGWPGVDFELPAQASARLQEMRVFFFQGGADEVVPAAHMTLYEKALPHATVRRLPGRNHQLDDDLTEIAAAIRQPAQLPNVRHERRAKGREAGLGTPAGTRS
jgi:predicted alpha/beta hydrolase family esterase